MLITTFLRTYRERRNLISGKITFIDHAPKVFVVGISTPVAKGYKDYLKYRDAVWNSEGFAQHQYEALVESAGRICYQSFNNPATRTRHDYIQDQIIAANHGSVLEGVWINFIIADLPRSSQLELVRHGDGTAFSFESTRFTHKVIRYVIPPRLREKKFLSQLSLWKWVIGAIEPVYMVLSEDLVDDSQTGTLKGKRAKEAARSILPNAQGSDGQVSINLRAIRHIIHTRTDPHADQSIRELGFAIYEAALPYFPGVLADATLEPQSEGVPWVRFEHVKV